MYETKFKRVSREVDQNIEQMLDDLREYLYGPTNGQISVRYAPSIVARSEAELLGLSKPRFAIRAYLGKHSFVNMRRKILLKESIRFLYENRGKQNLAEKLIDQLSTGGTDWIADSLLEIPATETQYDYLTTNLGTVYGEPSEFPSVPYMTHVRIGGGMCAQAAAFIALCLSKSRTKILGPSEITRLAYETQDSIPLDGFTPIEFQRVLSHRELGTSAVLQVVPSGPSRVSELSNILRAYLRSGIPVILLVSLSRIAGCHEQGPPRARNVGAILKCNEPKIAKLVPEKNWKEVFNNMNYRRNDHHCVVVVGWSKDKDKSQFSIHDPATLPFLEATGEQLMDIRRYSAPQGERVGQALVTLNPEDAPREPYQYLEILPLAPAGVVNTLAPLPPPDCDSKPGLGLYTVIQNVTGDPENPAGIHYHPTDFCGDQLFLANAATLQTKDSICAVELEAFKNPSALEDLLQRELRFTYCWLSLFPKPDISGAAHQSVWLWSAKTQTLDVRALQAVYVCSEHDGQFRWRQMFPKQTDSTTARLTP